MAIQVIQGWLEPTKKGVLYTEWLYILVLLGIDIWTRVVFMIIEANDYG